jgi:gamma-glutamyl:cysteine ligase YbdK (ATP-grasp superfamily)
MENFMKRFDFRADGRLLVGIERECFLTDLQGRIKPLAPKILEKLTDRKRFGYELSACQLEDRIGPVSLHILEKEILRNEEYLKVAESELQFKRLFIEVAPSEMPLDIYPDPTGRYQEITKNMPSEILLAACRVAATHVHIGMPDHHTALMVYNRVIGHLDELCYLGDGSDGERLQIYKKMAPDFLPYIYNAWDDFFKEAKVKGFENDPRKCWHLIRISIHGTLEFRMFGSTGSIRRIISWAQKCRALCEEALSP